MHMSTFEMKKRLKSLALKQGSPLQAIMVQRLPLDVQLLYADFD